MINIKGLSFSYKDKKILKNLNITIEENDKVAIIGPSGCGKSTLLYCLAGIHKSVNGDINWKYKPEIGLILQEYGLFPWKTVYDNVKLGLVVGKKKKTVKEDEILITLKQFDLLEHKDKYPSQLSGGQKQRVAIARTMILKPGLLLMDEPFSSLDAITREQLQNDLLNLYNTHSMTSVLVTHNIEEAVFMANKIWVMNTKGNIISTLNNQYFGDPEFRQKLDFYKVCLKIRSILEGNSERIYQEI